MILTTCSLARASRLLTVSLCLFVAVGAQAQVYPTKPVRLIIGLPPGGLIDTLARGVAQELTRIWGQTVIVENRPGATDAIAATAVARSAPDGYTIYLTTSTNVNTAQFLRHNLPYDPVKDFVPIVGLTETQEILSVNNKLPVNNVHELVALARSKPGQLNYGSYGIASAGHLEAEAFAKVTGTSFTHVPYKGVVDMLRGLLAGEVDFAWTGMTNAIPLVKQGQVKPMAYTGKRRSRALPQVPTLAEVGYEFEAGGLISLYAPTGTPKTVIDKIAADATRVRESATFQEHYIHGNGMEEFSAQGADLAARLQKSAEAFGVRIKGLNIKLE